MHVLHILYTFSMELLEFLIMSLILMKLMFDLGVIL